MRERIKEVMASVFDLSADQIPSDADTENLAEWDSLGHMNLMLALEAEFGVSLSTETMLELLSLGEIEAFLHTHSASAAERSNGPK